MTKEAAILHSRRGAENFFWRPAALPLVVEFAGNPGSGKTTNCLAFIDALGSLNIRVGTFADVKSYLYRSNVSSKWIMLRWFLRHHAYSVLRFSWVLVSHRLLGWETMVRYVKLCVFNSALQGYKQSRSVEIILLDQWSIQGLWSIALYSKSISEKLLKDLAHFLFSVDCLIYIDLEEQEAVGRIHGRHTKTSRFDWMDDHVRLQMLIDHSSALRHLFEAANCPVKMTLSGKRTPQENARFFTEWIRTNTIVPNARKL